MPSFAPLPSFRKWVFWLFSSLRARLILLVLLAIIPALLLVFYTAGEQRTAATRAAQDQALRLAQLVASDQNQIIESTRQLLTALAQLPVIRSGNPENCSAVFAQSLKALPNYTNIYMSDLDGAIVCSALPGAGGSAVDQRWYRDVLKTQAFAVGDYTIGRLTKKAVLGAGYPVYDDQRRMIYIVGASIDLMWISYKVGISYLPANTEFTAIDSNGTILFRYPAPELWTGKRFEYADVQEIAFKTKQGVTTSQDGERLFGFTPINSLTTNVSVLVGFGPQAIYDVSNRLLIQNLLGLALVALLTLALAWYGGGVLMLRPVRSLVNTTADIASGNYQVRAGLGRWSGELGALASAFNRMAEALERRQAQLARSNAELLEEVTVRKRAEEALREARDQLEIKVQERTADLKAANDEISAFAYIVSHDLRAPLVNLKGFSGELKQAVEVVKSTVDPLVSQLNEQESQPLKEALDSDIPEALKFISAAVTRMDHLTAAVLKLSRLGRRELKPEQIDMVGLTQTLVNSLAHQIKQKDVSLTVDSLPVVTADRVAMEQIMANLLTNAVNYLRAGVPGEITVRGEHGKDQTSFHIQDNGRGIAEDDRHKVFEPFRRAGREEVPGEGMGLAYVQTLVRRHGGRIWYTSTLNVGTTFSFTIPDTFKQGR